MIFYGFIHWPGWQICFPQTVGAGVGGLATITALRGSSFKPVVTYSGRAQARTNSGSLGGRDAHSATVWRKSVGEVDRHLVDQILTDSVYTPFLLTTDGARNLGAHGALVWSGTGGSQGDFLRGIMITPVLFKLHLAQETGFRSMSTGQHVLFLFCLAGFASMALSVPRRGKAAQAGCCRALQRIGERPR